MWHRRTGVAVKWGWGGFHPPWRARELKATDSGSCPRGSFDQQTANRGLSHRNKSPIAVRGLRACGMCSTFGMCSVCERRAVKACDRARSCCGAHGSLLGPAIRWWSAPPLCCRTHCSRSRSDWRAQRLLLTATVRRWGTRGARWPAPGTHLPTQRPWPVVIAAGTQGRT